MTIQLIVGLIETVVKSKYGRGDMSEFLPTSGSNTGCLFLLYRIVDINRSSGNGSGETCRKVVHLCVDEVLEICIYVSLDVAFRAKTHLEAISRILSAP